MSEYIDRPKSSIEWPLGRLPERIPLTKEKSTGLKIIIKSKNYGQAREFAGKFATEILDNTKDLKGKERFDTFVQKYLDVMYTLDILKKEAIGLGTPTGFTNMIGHFIGIQLFWQLSPDDYDLQKLQRLHEQVNQSTDARIQWFSPKIFFLIDKLADFQASNNLVKSCQVITPFAEQIITMLQKEIPDIEALLQDAAKELFSLRRYGIKTSMFQDGILHPPQDAWVLVDGSDLAIPGEYDKPLAGIMRGKASSIEMVDVTYHQLTSDRVRDEKMQAARIEGMNADFSWSMNHQGELMVGLFPLHSMPLRELFERQNKLLFYLLFQASHILRVCDLTIPIETVKNLPKLPEQSTNFLIRFLNKIRSNPLRPDLIIPRIKALENPELPELLESEIQQAEEETKKRSKRSHDVEKYIRKLPQGYKASKAARIRAKEEMGIDLQEGETYIRKHKRGKEEGGPGLTHRAKKR